MITQLCNRCAFRDDWVLNQPLITQLCNRCEIRDDSARTYEAERSTAACPYDSLRGGLCGVDSEWIVTKLFSEICAQLLHIGVERHFTGCILFAKAEKQHVAVFN